MADTFSVERETVIDAPPETIYERLADFHHWEAWSPWEDLDPDMSRTYGGADAGVGATYGWQGNRKVGEGSMEIVGTDAPTEVRIKLEFLKPFKAQNDTAFEIEPADGGTKVTWTMTGKKTFMTRVMGIFWPMDKVVGRDFEKGLARLKAAVESPAG